MALRVEVISRTHVKPYSPSSPPPYLNTLVPLTVFDLVNFDANVPSIYVFRAPMPDNKAVIDGLAKVLFHYPHLAGRLTADEHGHPCIALNDFGACVIEATVTTTLKDHLPLDPSSDLSNLYPPVDGVRELLQVQINRFACGGVIIGLASQHRVADGQSMSFFYIAWAKMVRGLDVPMVPYHDRPAISRPRDQPRCEFPHEIIEFKKKSPKPEIDVPAALARMANVCVHYSKDFVANIKTKVLNDVNCDVKRCSTFQCVLAHVWKKATFARNLDDDVVTQVRIGVNGRTRIKPPVPMEYFGNLVLWAFPRMKARELLDESYAQVVRTIHKAVAEVDDAYFKSYIDFGELMKRGQVHGGELEGSLPSAGESMCADLEINSWLGFEFHELDFGSGGPCTFLAPGLPMDGLTVLVPSCTEEGGVDVFIALRDEHAAVFRRVSHYLG